MTIRIVVPVGRLVPLMNVVFLAFVALTEYTFGV